METKIIEVVVGFFAGIAVTVAFIKYHVGNAIKQFVTKEIDALNEKIEALEAKAKADVVSVEKKVSTDVNDVKADVETVVTDVQKDASEVKL